jgi:hypothetical protein
MEVTMTSSFPDYRKFAASVAPIFGSDAVLLPTADEIASFGPDLPIDEAVANFKKFNSVRLDPELESTILLPEELQLYWQVNEAMGELFLGSASGLSYRKIDPSQQSLEFFGAPLGNYRIIDEVANVGGPFFTLVQLDGDHLREQLYFFDTRKCWEISIGVKEYLDIAMKSFAPLYWQCLFTDEPLASPRATALDKSLAYLANKADSAQLAKLAQALDAKRQN